MLLAVPEAVRSQPCTVRALPRVVILEVSGHFGTGEAKCFSQCSMERTGDCVVIRSILSNSWHALDSRSSHAGGLTGLRSRSLGVCEGAVGARRVRCCFGIEA